MTERTYLGGCAKYGFQRRTEMKSTLKDARRYRGSLWIALTSLLLLFSLEPARSDLLRVFVEPKERKTFYSEEVLKKNATIRVKVIDRAGGGVIRLHRCGEECDTAETVMLWGNYSNGSSIEYTIGVEGRYYLWVENQQEEVDDNAIKIQEWADTEDKFLIVFESGLKVDVRIDSANAR